MVIFPPEVVDRVAWARERANDGTHTSEAHRAATEFLAMFDAAMTARDLVAPPAKPAEPAPPVSRSAPTSGGSATVSSGTVTSPTPGGSASSAMSSTTSATVSGGRTVSSGGKD